MGQTIRPMTEDEWAALKIEGVAEGLQEDEAVRQSYDRTLMLTELSEYDLSNIEDIIRKDKGDWFHAKLLRALHTLLPDADANNKRLLRSIYPGTCAAYLAWYNRRLDEAH